MRTRAIFSLLAALLVSGCAIAQPAAKPDEDHSAHHPSVGALAASAAQPVSADASGTQAYERQMKAMQAMHLKLQAAQTLAERATLMNDHMQLMQSGMAMMGAMRGTRAMGGPGSQSPQGGMGMMDPPRASASPDAAPGVSGPVMQGMAGMMNMHTHGAPHGHDGADDANDGRPRGGHARQVNIQP